MFKEFLSILNKLEIEPSSEEVLEILWLALQMQPPKNKSDHSMEPSTNLSSSSQNLNQNNDTQPKDSNSRQPTPPHNLYNSHGKENLSDNNNTGFPIPISTAKILNNSLELMRALRPLKQKKLSKKHLVFDQEATIKRIVEQDIWVPVMRPTGVKMFNLVLIIDEESSMFIWNQTINEFRAILEYIGAFRNITCLSLIINANNSPDLYAKQNTQTNNLTKKCPSKFNSSNNLILIASDCISPAWNNGEIANLISSWSNTNLVTILQMFPESLWPRTKIASMSKVQVTAKFPQTPNNKLEKHKMIGQWYNNKSLDGTPVPIITLEPEILAEWSSLVSRRLPTTVTSILFESENCDINKNVNKNISNTSCLKAEDLVQNFYSTSSPIARKLAGLLAAVPVSMPIVNLVRRAILPQATQLHLAEVFLSGLLKRTIPSQTSDYIEYEFVEGVREILLNSLKLSDSINVIKKVSQYLTKNFGNSLKFLSLIEISSKSDIKGVPIPAYAQPFATITAMTLERYGGKYKQAAKILKTHLSLSEPITKQLYDRIKALQTELQNIEKQLSSTDPISPNLQSTLDRYRQELNEYLTKVHNQLNNFKTNFRQQHQVKQLQAELRDIENQLLLTTNTTQLIDRFNRQKQALTEGVLNLKLILNTSLKFGGNISDIKQQIYNSEAELEAIGQHLALLTNEANQNIILQERKQQLLTHLASFTPIEDSLTELDTYRTEEQANTLKAEIQKVENLLSALLNRTINQQLLDSQNNLKSVSNLKTNHNLPERNRFFTGRVDVLNQLYDLIKSNQRVTTKQAIIGMGGIGKTQTALEFCYRHINDYQTILWVMAANETLFNKSYYNVVDLLNLAPKSGDGASNQGLKADEVISLVKSWLANNPNWLMVLDNLEDPKLIKDYLPANHQGHVLITTRSQSLKGYAAIVQLKKMSDETGILFLLKRANLIPIEANSLEQLKADNKIGDVLIADAQKIVQAMDGLPLALEQAGDYIQENACSLTDYLKLYKNTRNTFDLSHSDWNVRYKAVESLEKIKTEKAFELLLKALSDSHNLVRSKAARALGKPGNDKAVDPLVKALSDSHSQVRSDAIFALGKIGNDKVVDVLIKILFGSDEMLYLITANALTQIGTDKAIDALISALSNSNKQLLRSSVAIALEHTTNNKAIDALVLALSDPDMDVRFHAASALAKTGNNKAVDVLFSLLSASDPLMRSNVVRALTKIKTDQAVDALTTALSDSDSYVRLTAVESLGQIGSSRAIESLIKDLSESDSDSRVRSSAKKTLTQIRNRKQDPKHKTKLQTWEEYWEQHKKESLVSGSFPPLIGTQEEINDLRQALENSDIKIINVVGLPGIGKTRLVLEATAIYKNKTFISLNPNSILDSDLYLLESNEEAIIIIENPNLANVSKLAQYCLNSNKIKLILTFLTPIDISKNEFKLLSKSKTISLSPLAFMQTDKLLKATEAKFDFAMQSWVIEHLEGYPGHILEAMRSKANLKTHYSEFLQKVSQPLEKIIIQKYGTTIFNRLKLLSILSPIDIGEDSSEIEVVCKAFSSKDTLVRESLSFFVQERLLNINESKATVYPTFFANYAASSLLEKQPDSLWELFLSLNYYDRPRLLKRLSYIDSDIIKPFWDKIEKALSENFQDALNSDELLITFSNSVPQQAAYLIENNLRLLSHENRSELSKNSTLISAIKNILYRKITAEIGLNCLILLAETEEENLNTNLTPLSGNYEATSLFCKFFRALYAQSPLPLDDRLKILRNLFSEQVSESFHILGIRAIGNAFELDRDNILTPYHSTAKPYDAMPVMSYEQLWKYNENLLDLLIEQIIYKTSSIAQLAQHILCDALNRSAVHLNSNRPECIQKEVFISKLNKISDHIFSHNMAFIPIGRLVDAMVSGQKALETRKTKAEKSNSSEAIKYVKNLNLHIDQLAQLIKRFDESDFFLQLLRWAGHWSFQYSKKMTAEEESNNTTRGQRELKILAEKAIDNPKLLSSQELEKLCLTAKDSSNIYTFCRSLGELDKNHLFIDKIEKLAFQQNGTHAFAGYFEGLSKNDKFFVSERLDALCENKNITAEALIVATNDSNGDITGAERIIRLIQEKKITLETVSKLLRHPRWIWDLPFQRSLSLLKTLAGDDLEYASNIIEIMWMFDSKKQLEQPLREFLWQCLEKSCNKIDLEYDRLAAILANYDTEPAFTLLEKTVITPYNLKLITHNNNNQFWKILINKDRERVIHLILTTTLKFDKQDDLTRVFDMKKDSDLLLNYAFTDEKQALLLCRYVTLPLEYILQILEKYPISDRVLQALNDNFLWPRSRIYSGSTFSLFKSHYDQLMQYFNTPNLSVTSISWLKNMQEYLEEYLQINQQNQQENTSITNFIEDEDDYDDTV